MAVQFGFENLNSLQNVFRNLGTCESRIITKSSDMDQLLQCYMLRYKENNLGKSGPGIDSSINYLFNEKLTEVMAELESNTEFAKIFEIIKSLKNNGLCGDMDIIIAVDTSINKQLIVDGTNRSLALYYIITKEESRFMELLKSKSSHSYAKILYL